jgi:hypothetical protein
MIARPSTPYTDTVGTLVVSIAFGVCKRDWSALHLLARLPLSNHNPLRLWFAATMTPEATMRPLPTANGVHQ